MTTESENHVGELLSGYLDGELTHQQSQRVRVHCDACAQCRAELDELAALRERVGAADLAANEIDWSEKVSDATDQATRGLGWVLFIVGVVGLTAWGVYEFVIDTSIDPFYKVLTGAVYLGLAVLFVNVLRRRIMESKTDKYNNVEI